ncbi:MAG: cytochrome c oxidase subunit II [Acidiferrobacterales bacterium]
MSLSFKNRKSSRPRTVAWARFAAALATLLGAGTASAGIRWNFQTPVTPMAHQIFHLQNIMFGVCVAIFVLVFGVMFYSIFAHRKSKGHKPATFHQSTTVEIIWTAVPLLILVAIAVPATATLVKMENTSDSALTVRITGYQWKWHYSYPAQGIGFFSDLSTPVAQIENQAPKNKHYLLQVDHPLVLPVGEKIRFQITSGDVIHSWWVPSFGVKTDAIPGFINQTWTEIEVPGTYRGQCTELCGMGHAFMPVVVKAVSQKDFQKWVTAQKALMVASAAGSTKTYSEADLLSHGKTVFAANCAACHQITGQGIPGTFPPLSAGRKFSATPAMLTQLRSRGFLTKGGRIVMGPVKNHLGIVLHGIPGTPMPSFAGQLSDTDIAAVVTYERNSFGNHTGDIIEPSQVAAVR